MIEFETSLKVRSYECDLYGHVNNANFLNYCEYARVEFLNEFGFNLETLRKEGFLLPIVKIEIEYKTPVYTGDILKLAVQWKERGRSSSVFVQEIIRQKDEKLAARAVVTWVVTDLRGKPISLPDVLLDRVKNRYNELPPKRNSEK